MPNFASGHVVTNTEFNLMTPVGTVFPFAGSSAPSTWLICDGSAVSRSTYADLFAVIGTTYGTGDGSTTFNLPDCRGRMVVGKGTHADVSTLGANEGQATAANRRPKHRTTVTDNGHSHTGPSGKSIVYDTGSNGFAASSQGGQWTTNATTASATTGITAGTGNANDPVDTSPYLVLNYIIKA